MPQLPKNLQRKLKKRVDEQSLRNLTQTKGLIDFSSNDYLGFAQSEAIYANTFQLLLKKGISSNGATGSRLLSGNHELFKEVETTIAGFHEVESALIFNSGYDANVGFFSSVPQRGDTVIYDEFIHASIRDGIKMGHAKSYKFAHNDLDNLTMVIERCRNAMDAINEIYIVTESIFSMDGDSPDLRSIASLCIAKSCHLVVDEAHAIGVLGDKGEGIVHQMKLQNTVFATIITFGKALGAHGAAILGSTNLTNYLINFARSFVYTTALSPHAVATLNSVYEYLPNAKVERQKLMENITHFKNKIVKLKLNLTDESNNKAIFIPSASTIHSCIIPGNERVKSISKKLSDDGFDVRAILSPTVPEGQERLRFCLHSFNSKEEIAYVLQLLKSYL